MKTMEIDFPFLSRERSRHGKARLYVRRYGRRVRVTEKPGSPEFAAAYHAAIEALEGPRGKTPAVRKIAAARGTFGWLAAQYFGSQEFDALDKVSQRRRRAIIEACLMEPRKPGSPDLMRDCPIAVLSAAHVQVLRDRRAEKKGAANNRLKYLKAMFGWAVEARHLTRNPANDVRPLRYASSGFYTWTVDDVRKFEARHPIGTKARLALALLLFTGARRGDVVTFGRQHVREGWLRYVPRKTRYRRVTLSEKPVLPVLADIIARSPCGELTFLVTAQGKSYSAAGFGNWFRTQCDLAGLPQCSAHGLRKAGATIAAENGATDRQLMAMYDWTSSHQATTYTEAADRRRLAADGMKLIRDGGT